MTREHASAYLAALIDGEGCVAVYDYRIPPREGLKTPPRISRSITIGMCDKEVLDYASRCLERIGVAFGRYVRERGGRHKTFHVLYIKPTYNNICRLLKSVRLKHKGKRQRLVLMQKSFVWKYEKQRNAA